MSLGSLFQITKTAIRKKRFLQALYAFLVVSGLKKDRDLLRRIKPNQKISPTWSEGDNLSETIGWNNIVVDLPKFNFNKNLPPKVMFLNSMGGSMSRLSRALMMHQGIEASCYINAFYARRNMVFELETNVNGVFTHAEWREFMKWAVKEHDIIQSTTLPSWPGVAECYDWLTETIGQRHIWRSTGFVHHYLRKDNILPICEYQRDLELDRVPAPENFTGKSFPIIDNKFQLGENVLFYSSPEKGEYFEGKNKLWLPSIRSPHSFSPSFQEPESSSDAPVKIYVPYHKRAVFKGMEQMMTKLSQMKAQGANIEIITPENASTILPELNGFKDLDKHGVSAGAYPIPNHHIASILRQVDIVVDQIIMGSYGNTGIEAMMCGKPVVGQKHYPEIQGAPIVSVTPETFKSTVEDLIENRGQWRELGEAGRAWALQHHSPEVVSKVAADVYKQVLERASLNI